MQTFKDWLKLNGKSKNTIRGYLYNTTRYIEGVSGKYDQESLDRYFLNLQNNLTNKSINAHRNAVSSFLKFKKIRLEMPSALKVISKIPDAITLEELETIMLEVEEIFYDPDKVKLLLYFMMYTGLRPSEVASLERKNIDLKNNQGIVTRDKNYMEDIFIFTPKLANLMKIYFLNAPEETNAFNTTVRALQYYCERLRKSFPQFHIRPYLFRHSSATLLLSLGFTQIEIQHHLGHKSIMSSQHYLKFDNNILKKKYLEKIN